MAKLFQGEDNSQTFLLNHTIAEMPTLEGPNAGGLPSLEGPNAGGKIKMLEVYIACYNFL